MLIYGEGIVHYQVHSWTDLPHAIHKLSRLIPNSHPFKRKYQLFYQVCFCASYIYIIIYLLFYCPYTYSKDYGFYIHFSLYFPLLALEVYWLIQSSYIFIQLIYALKYPAYTIKQMIYLPLIRVLET